MLLCDAVLFLVTLIFIITIVYCDGNCQTSSITTTSGTFKHNRHICSGDLIFSDDFDFFDLKKWEHENTLAGGGNYEFQWYTNNRTNSYVENSILHIKPTLTVDHLGLQALTTQTLNLHGGAPADKCTNEATYGCIRTGNNQHILNPIKSARIRTAESFSFRYGRVEVRAKMPAGDWLWPAVWMLPRYNTYGFYPASGEIDIAEGRGNRELVLDGVNIGTQQIGSTLHWGPDYSQNRYTRTNWAKHNDKGFDGNFHVYEVLWDENHIKFSIDTEEVGHVRPSAGGFWQLGNLNQTGYDNPWRGASKMAPFDQEFYLIINLAVGGIAYFPDAADNSTPKPWSNKSPKAATDFWNGRSSWQPTWSDPHSSLQVDYVRVYAV